MQAQARSEGIDVTSDDALWVVKADDDGFQVYNPAEPDRVYRVSGNRAEPQCTCPEFRWKMSGNANEGCAHIGAVMGYLGEYELPQPKPNGRERMASGNGSHPAPAAGGNGNGGELGASAAMLMLKRSVSPDGKINSLSVEFALPIGGLLPQEVRDCALRGLACQEDIVATFLSDAPVPASGNGYNESSDTRDGAVPATLRDVGGMNTRWGWRNFINVETDGGVYKLFGNRKQLGEHLASVGQSRRGEQINKGTVLNIPCMAVLAASDDGRYTNVVELYPSPQRQSHGR